MISILSRAYAFVLVALILLLIVTVLNLHIAMLLGSHFEPNEWFFAIWFGINLPIIALAEDRNIARNEVKQCPPSLRGIFKVLFVYFLFIAILCIFHGDMHSPNTFYTASSAFMLLFTCGSACVLWVTVKSVTQNPSELRQKTGRSLVSVAVFSALCLISTLLPAKTLR